jgi:hypothetical protein
MPASPAPDWQGFVIGGDIENATPHFGSDTGRQAGKRRVGQTHRKCEAGGLAGSEAMPAPRLRNEGAATLGRVVFFLYTATANFGQVPITHFGTSPSAVVPG